MISSQAIQKCRRSLQVFNAVPQALFSAAAELALMSSGFKGCPVPNTALKRYFGTSSDILAALRVPSKRAWGRLNLQCRSFIPESLSIIEINLHKMEENHLT
jgi:hypothetical protein